MLEPPIVPCPLPRPEPTALHSRLGERCRCFGYLPERVTGQTCSRWHETPGSWKPGDYGWRPPVYRTEACSSAADQPVLDPDGDPPPWIGITRWRGKVGERWMLVSWDVRINKPTARLWEDTWWRFVEGSEATEVFAAWALHESKVADAEQALRKAVVAEDDARLDLTSIREEDGDDEEAERAVEAAEAHVAACEANLRKLGREP